MKNPALGGSIFEKIPIIKSSESTSTLCRKFKTKPKSMNIPQSKRQLKNTTKEFIPDDFRKET